MAETARTDFKKYIPLLIQALRTKDPAPMRPAEAIAWVRAHTTIPERELTTRVENGKQTLFENDVHWTRYYLAKEGYIDRSRRGLWGLTEQGHQVDLGSIDVLNLAARVRKGDQLAPDLAGGEADDGRTYWLAGSLWGKEGDQLPRYRQQGVWEHQGQDRAETIRRIRPGDRIAIKATFSSTRVPFDAGGKPVSTMRIKATGTVVENPGDGRSVKVAWDPATEERNWYFSTYRTALSEINGESETGRRLIQFVFEGEKQDYDWFLTQPYWQEKYGPKSDATASLPALPGVIAGVEEELDDEEPEYAIAQVIEEGCFLSERELTQLLDEWKSRKNLILQGPPGTGKTWLAKRLGYVLIGSNDREADQFRLRVVQFHPSLAYEDFVRGWRPSGDGRLTLVDGIMMQAIAAAQSEPGRPFVLVIEEVNRGNPAQIFGEMLTLLEASKRRTSEAIELAYRKGPAERVHIPENLYIVGTMNVADRSLALVDLALRRRFAFKTLEPQFNAAWRAFCVSRGLPRALVAEVGARMQALNQQIATAPTLGPHFCVGHSFVTPEGEDSITDARAWFRAKVEMGIGPQLEEYWYDAPETAKEALNRLLAELD